MASPQELAALARARELALSVSLADGPNPRVGCVILDAAGRVVGEGAHRGAGTPHAEVVALADAGVEARGGTAVVTLEPCHHVGRTGPCSRALTNAGIDRVVFGQPDPHALAAGGAQALSMAGVDVEGGVEAVECERLNTAWSFAVTHGRPFVTVKTASTLDGRVAASDGTSRWVTGEESRRDVHLLRSRCDAILVGTGTALVDDPSLTVRLVPVPETGEPLRVVMGHRDLQPDASLLHGAAQTLHLRTHDVDEVLSALALRDVRHLLVEGGPTIVSAFLTAGVVDEVVWYVAPALLGSGHSAMADLGIDTIDGAIRLRDVHVAQIGSDARISGRVS
jgi:diaminohydroxyphosphoribosylaminopyrimidine deaminase / 5-amino-6-(5-phosphoribosylamino)uracil reductase